MAHRSGQFVNLTISVDTGILMLAKHRALLERMSVNRYLAAQLEDYADGALDAARRTNTARTCTALWRRSGSCAGKNVRVEEPRA
jgi:uncharacterized protein YciW